MALACVAMTEMPMTSQPVVWLPLEVVSEDPCRPRVRQMP